MAALGARASPWGGPSCCGPQAPGAWASVVVAHGLQSAGPTAVAPGLSCSTACGIFPDQGSNPCPSGLPTTATPGKSQNMGFCFCSHPHHQAITNLSVAFSLSFLDISYKWSQGLCDFFFFWSDFFHLA